MKPQYEMKFVVLIIYDIIIMISDNFCRVDMIYKALKLKTE